MLGWIILGVFVALITLIMLVPIGADIAYECGELRLSAKIAGVLLQLLPKPPVDESKPPKEKKAKKPKKEKKKKEASAGEKPKKKRKLEFSLQEIFALIKAVLRGFGLFGRKLRVDRFLLHLTAAGKDPYDTAMLFGYINGALSSLAPICEKRFAVKDCSVRTDVDFTEEKMKVDFGIAVTIRIGAIFRMVFTILFGAAWILIKNKVRLLIEKIKNKKSGSKDVPAENDAVITETQNIHDEERIDNNGK